MTAAAASTCPSRPYWRSGAAPKLEGWEIEHVIQYLRAERDGKDKHDQYWVDTVEKAHGYAAEQYPVMGSSHGRTRSERRPTHG